MRSSICCIVQYLNVTKSDLRFVIKHALNTVGVHYSLLLMHYRCTTLGL